MYWNEHIQCHNSLIPLRENLSESVEYANLKICILRNERLEDCNEMQLISSNSLTLFVYTARCRDDFNLNKEYNRGSAEYANFKIGILRNER